MHELTDRPTPDCCALQHRAFARFEDPLFRRAETDGAPAMVVRLGEREAAIPLRSLQAELGIPDDSADGRMLATIADALDFVHGLHLGDPLPAEVLTGEASWRTDPQHVRRAVARLRLQLVAWLNTASGLAAPDEAAGSLLQAEQDAGLRQRIQEAFERAAEALGLADAESVVRRVESLAEELAFIEALRDRLLRRVTLMAGRIERLGRNIRNSGANLETLTEVRRLAVLALRQISQRFDELDAQTGQVMPALRNADSHGAFIRSNRDWLYRSLRGWEPILAEWDAAGAELPRGLMSRTYQFLAPRFMPVSEWIARDRVAAARAQRQQMVW